MNEDPKERADRVGGLGYQKKLKGELNAVKNPKNDGKFDINKLEGANMDDLKYLD
jgi:hypothetical protein